MKNSNIHFVWTIAVLLLVISALLWRLPNGDKLANYIAFAASLASLVLAVVAIFQALLSSKSIDHAITKIQNSADAIVKQTERLNQATVSLGEEANNTLEKLSELPDRIHNWKSEISEQLTQLSVPTSYTGVASNSDLSELNKINGKIVGYIISLYLVCLSYKTGKPIEAKSVFPGDEYAIIRNFSLGVLTAIQHNPANGLKIEGVGGSFRIDSLGEYEADKIIDGVQKSKFTAGVQADAVLAVNRYFSVDKEVIIIETEKNDTNPEQDSHTE